MRNPKDCSSTYCVISPWYWDDVQKMHKMHRRKPMEIYCEHFLFLSSARKIFWHWISWKAQCYAYMNASEHEYLFFISSYRHQDVDMYLIQLSMIYTQLFSCSSQNKMYLGLFVIIWYQINIARTPETCSMKSNYAWLIRSLKHNVIALIKSTWLEGDGDWWVTSALHLSCCERQYSSQVSSNISKSTWHVKISPVVTFT